MNQTDISEELIEQISTAIADGRKNIGIWGVNPITFKILSFLSGSDLLSNVTAVIDDITNKNGKLFQINVIAPRQLPNTELDTLVITNDKEKEQILEKFEKYDCRIPHVIIGGNSNYEFDDPIFNKIIKSCMVKSKAGGYPYMLIHLFQSLKYISLRKLEGDIVEFGVYQGGTTVFMAKVLKHLNNPRKIYGFDTFQGFPSTRSVFDLYDESSCEFHDYDSVYNYCKRYNIELVVGDIRDTYTKLKNIPLALTFFDTDNYSSIVNALELCAEQTVQNGILAFDHYFSPGWNRTIGERIAVHQVLNNKPFLNLHGTGIFIKT